MPPAARRVRRCLFVALRYTFTVLNDGHAVLHNVTLSDPSLVSGIAAPVAVEGDRHHVETLIFVGPECMPRDQLQPRCDRRTLSSIVGKVCEGKMRASDWRWEPSLKLRGNLLPPLLAGGGVLLCNWSCALAGGSSLLRCDKAFAADGVSVVLSSPLALHASVTCNGSHALTAEDVDNLERRSDAIVTAVDEYEKEVSAAKTEVIVALAQVMKLHFGCQQEGGCGGHARWVHVVA